MASARGKTLFGDIEVVATRTGVRRIRFPRDRSSTNVSDESPQARALARSVAKKIDRYYRGDIVNFDEPLDLDGSPEFFRQVWTELRKVPRGETISYSELARRAGRPKAVRAVGTAMARNPVPVIVPCHRVIRSDGTLGGFGGGLDLKRRMLELEKG